MELPQLGVMPWYHLQQPTIKATSAGITYLWDNKFGKRYTGNKRSAVDREGRLWLKASELKKHLVSVEERRKYLKELSSFAVESYDKPGVWYWLSDKRPKEKARVETQAGDKKISLNQLPMQISENLSTSETVLLTTANHLSPRSPRAYRVNKREVRQRILAMLNTQRGKKELYFWTVTFFEGMADDLCYRVFNIWLTALRQYGLLKEYIWVAERQENGTVHFHVAIAHKMPVQRANGMMRGTLKTFAKRGELHESIYRCNRYNGVDIAKNRKTKRVVNFAIKKGSRALANYLTKYVTKNDTSFSHLAWHNSRGYSSLFTGVTFTIQEFKNNGWPDMLKREKRFDGEFFTFIPWLGDPPEPLMKHLFDLNSYIQNVLN